MFTILPNRIKLEAWVCYACGIFSVLLPNLAQANISSMPEDGQIEQAGINKDSIDRADVIVVGSIEKESEHFFEPVNPDNVHSSTNADTNLYRCVFTVKSVLKGKCNQVITLHLRFPVSADARSWFFPNSFPLLLALKYQGTGDFYEPIDQPSSWLSLLSNKIGVNVSSEVKPNLTPLIQSILSVDFAKVDMADSKTIFSNDIGPYQDALIPEASFSIIQAIGTAENLHLVSKELLVELQNLWRSPNLEVRMKALEASFVLGDATAVAYCSQQWHSNYSDQIERGQIEYLLRHAQLRIKRQGDLAGILPFLNSDIPQVRRDAMLILRESKNPIYIALFVKGVTDPDAMVQYHSIMGLYLLDPALFKEQHLIAPGIILFNANPDKYTATWKAWLEDGGTNTLRSDLNIN
jgi:hypothetical protein